VAIEIETGKSDIPANLRKLKLAEIDRVILLGTTPSAVSSCRSAFKLASHDCPPTTIWSWLDVS
jgi:hypothetical protein